VYDFKIKRSNDDLNATEDVYGLDTCWYCSYSLSAWL